MIYIFAITSARSSTERIREKKKGLALNVPLKRGLLTKQSAVITRNERIRKSDFGTLVPESERVRLISFGIYKAPKMFVTRAKKLGKIQ